MQIATIGLDLARHVFQIHSSNAAGSCIMKRRLRRHQVLEFFTGLPPCLVGMEACGMAHYWARDLRELRHDVQLMPAHYV